MRKTLLQLKERINLAGYAQLGYTKEIMEHKIAEPNARVDVADVLRGLAGHYSLAQYRTFQFLLFPERGPF
ncbi:hypothetical protein [Bacteroides acidifaciens]|uniref:hypothetical protein n=1 Tax=Bacteroides acidifaciens TaxID=85831 RepID=UPI0020CA6774|nr:hypothetical protein [Bacteroides acidifaciens]